MTAFTVQISNLSKAFDGPPVVDQVSFNVAPGEILTLLGPSGCGKTTLLRLIAGFEQPDDGSIVIDGRTVVGGGPIVPPEQRRVGMVFQDYAIFPHLSVQDNVGFGVARRAERAERVNNMLTLVGLQGIGNTMPHQLSGGQQQRVALARALAPAPAVLLLDEPFSNLDATLRQRVRREVRDLLKLANITAIFVTHDQEEAITLGDRVAVMRAGRLEQIGRPEEVFHRPATRFVAEFVGQADVIAGQAVEGGVTTALGRLAQTVRAATGATVEIALRPDDVAVQRVAADAANAIVLARQFAGIDNFYTLRLRDGVIVRSRQPHTLMLAPGTPVRATLAADHPLPVFWEGQAV